MYVQIAKTFFDAVWKNAQQHRIRLYEYYRDDWTYHVKGLWATLRGHQHPCLTLVGSTNFGEYLYLNNHMKFLVHSTSYQESSSFAELGFKKFLCLRKRWCQILLLKIREFTWLVPSRGNARSDIKRTLFCTAVELCECSDVLDWCCFYQSEKNRLLGFGHRRSSTVQGDGCSTGCSHILENIYLTLPNSNVWRSPIMFYRWQLNEV